MQDFSQEQKDFIQNLFLNLGNTINEKTDELREEFKKQIIDLKSEVVTCINKSKQRIKTLEIENAKLTQTVNNLERRIRKNNLIIFGLCTEERDLTSSVIKLFNEINVIIQPSDLNDVYRIRTRSSTSPVIVELISFQTKQLILKNAHKLKGKNIYISQDQTTEDRKIRQILLVHQKQARAKGELAYIKGDKLYIGKEPYTANQLENSESEDFQEGSQEQEKPNSAPSTPCHIARQKKLQQEFGFDDESIIASEAQTNKGKSKKEQESSITRFTRSNLKRT